MIAASLELQRKMVDTRAFVYAAEITFTDNTMLTLTEGDLCGSGSSIVISAGSSSFPVGNALSRCLKLKFLNINDRFAEYDFYGAKIRVTASMELSETTEVLDLGTFTVTEPETYGDTISIVAYDDMYKADAVYETGLSFPMTAADLFQDACLKCGLVPLTMNFTNKDYSVKNKPNNLSCRQVIGLCAMLAGGNAIMAPGGVKIVEYDSEALEALSIIDGGIFDSGNPYRTGANVYGGKFNPWDEGDDVNGGAFSELRDLQIFTEVMSQTVGTDDVVITGIKIKNGEDEYPYGTDGYVLVFENTLTDGAEQDAAERIGHCLIGMKFRPFALDTPSYPLAEFGDTCYVVHKGNVYASFITDIEFDFKGATTLKCSADSPIRNSSKDFTAKTSSERRMRKLIANEASARELLEQNINQRINNSPGLYPSTEVTQSGTIYYLHDKPELATSKTVIKITSNGIALTDNYKGSQTSWQSAITVDGTMIANIVSTIGLFFDYAHGGTLTLGGQNNVSGSLRVLDASGNEIGKWDNTGISLTKGSINLGSGKFVVTTGGSLTAQDGQIANFTIKTDSLRYNSGGVYGEYNTNYKDKVYMGENGVADTAANTELSTVLHGGQLVFGTLNIPGIIISNSTDMGDDFWFRRLYMWGLGNSGHYVAATYNGDFNFFMPVRMQSNLYVTGTKSRIADTEDYGDRLLYCYETPSPLFGDIGEGMIADDGYSYIQLDPIFTETISTNQYQVFLQKYGDGDCYVVDRKPTYFIVRGTPGIEFGWEIKAKQRGYDQKRLDQNTAIDPIEYPLLFGVDKDQTDYGEEAINHIEDITKEREASI